MAPGKSACRMNGRFYRWTRDLHLYLGLFISPFVLVFRRRACRAPLHLAWDRSVAACFAWVSAGSSEIRPTPADLARAKRLANSTGVTGSGTVARVELMGLTRSAKAPGQGSLPARRLAGLAPGSARMGGCRARVTKLAKGRAGDRVVH